MGGAGGHMRHPHDLDEVQSGQDIIALFRAIPAYLRKEEFKKGETTSLKLDGSNNAIKVIESGDDIQFAVDRGGRGTTDITAIDVAGVTIDRLQDRFPKNPGLANSSAGLINMMARAYNENKDEMKGLLIGLGLISKEGAPDPTKFINIEYIDRVPEDIDSKTGMGRANVIYYPFDFITFLNISQFYEVVTMVSQKDPVTRKSLKAPGGKVIRKKETTRTGAPRPTINVLNNDGDWVEQETDDKSKPIDFNKGFLDELAKLVAPYAPKSKSDQQFKVLGPSDLEIGVDHDTEEGEDTSIASERAIDQLSQNIENTLNSDLTFRISDQTAVTKSLEEWLNMAKNFLHKPDITLIDGSKKNPFHGLLHKELVNSQTPLDKLVPLGDDLQCEFDGSLSDCEKAIYGAIFNEAARRLGNTVKQSLQSKVEKFGNTVDHEGVVINAGMEFGSKKTSHTFKLTGEFIIDKDQGVYAMREHIEDEDEDPVTDEEFSKETIAVVPGAFKPPHKGHADMVKRYITGKGIPTKADKVIVIISKPTKKGRYLPIQEKEVLATHSKRIWENILLPSVGLGYPEVEVIVSPMASPVQAAYEYVGKNSPLDPRTQRVILGASNKLDQRSGIPDWHRWNNAVGSGKEVVGDDGNVVKLEILDPETHAVECLDRSCDLPFSATDMRELVSKLIKNPDDEEAKNELAEFIPKKDIRELLSIFSDSDKKIEKPSKELEEMSGHAAVGGFAGSIGTVERPVPGKRNKKRKKQQEIIDTSLIDDVMRLIMERGISQ